MRICRDESKSKFCRLPQRLNKHKEQKGVLDHLSGLDVLNKLRDGYMTRFQNAQRQVKVLKSQVRIAKMVVVD